MAKTRIISRVAAPWSDLGHDVLYIVMMQLGVIDFLAFGVVCKSWRSLALNNKTKFMASKTPMHIDFSDCIYKKTCSLQDGEGREFKTNIPHSAGRTCVGVTCGYVILFGDETHDFWLVNPITGQELHFPNVSFYVDFHCNRARAILVYSPSLSALVFVITNLFYRKVWFSIAGKGAWNHVSSNNHFLDLHAFKGKIYALNTGHPYWELDHICELTLNPEPKLTIVETKNIPGPGLKWEFVSSDESLYVVQRFSHQPERKIRELDIGEMKWVSHEKTTSEYTFFLSYAKSGAAVKRLSNMTPARGKLWLNYANMWYFPHDCFIVNRLEV